MPCHERGEHYNTTDNCNSNVKISDKEEDPPLTESVKPIRVFLRNIALHSRIVKKLDVMLAIYLCRIIVSDLDLSMSVLTQLHNLIKVGI
jgi:hypothetical protein